MGVGKIGLIIENEQLRVRRDMQKVTEKELLMLIGCMDSLKAELIAFHHNILAGRSK